MGRCGAGVRSDSPGCGTPAARPRGGRGRRPRVVAAVCRACPPARLHITVTGRGPGMLEDRRQRVFERFLRLEGPQVPGHIASQDAGFGLSRCRQIVAARGGAI
jgi:K+-sensing histidine kinase KdpD